MIVKYLGLQDYQTIYDSMCHFADQRTLDKEDELWVLEHFPVFTLGKAGKATHLVHKTDIPIIRSDRGGQITYHGPGQAVVYTMINLIRKTISVHELVLLLEQAIVDTLKDYEIVGNNNIKRPGVYVRGKKIASLGLRVKNNCVYHGLSLNVDMDLSPFNAIHPCGYADLEMTQVRNLITPCPSMMEISKKLVQYLQAIL